jgi:flagellar biosynthesis chaperone FliJ
VTGIVRFLIPYLLIAALSSIGSWKASEWRCGLASASQITALNDRIHTLELAISEANKATEIAKAQSDAAAMVQAEAQKRANDMAVLSKSRLDRLAQTFAAATSCDDVLKNYWGMRE